MDDVLVIVESPTKAKTIKNYLPKEFKIHASMGHIRDLPQSAADIPEAVKKESWATLGVNVDGDFDPLYIIPKDKKKVVTELKKALKTSKEIILATDEDREGESISWHLQEVLKPKVPVKRMVFHEITKEAIQSAIDNCREVNSDLVKAQETRRIMDRLVGYGISPLLWRKVSKGLSAGRVQSVSVRLLVLRERQRREFVSASYWGMKANLKKSSKDFDATLTHYEGEKLAIGKDFDDSTGELIPGRKVILIGEQKIRELKERFSSQPWIVDSIEEKKSTRKPSPPFTTSTLQQESNRKLKLSARDTMRIAQSLYERGLITYMRTDSVHLSDQAITAARTHVEKMYGKEFLSPQPRQFTTKSKGAQEAHEAIRPSGVSFQLPQHTGLNGVELRLYDLIWKRTMACQMADAKQTHVTMNIKVDEGLFKATGKRIDFAGFFRAYVEGSDDPEAALDDKEVHLPKVKEGEELKFNQLDLNHHETHPPARYTEASLVKMLEQEGVGRPSTYATIISTIIDRGYSIKKGEALVPTYTAIAVTRLLEHHFNDLVDTKFTAKMEQTLDEIALGKENWLGYLKTFYKGEKGLSSLIEKKIDEIAAGEYKSLGFDNLKSKVCIGKFGPYVEKEENGETIIAAIPPDVLPDELDEAKVETIIRQKQKWNNELGYDPDTKEPIYLLNGIYGPYVQRGVTTDDPDNKPKRVSLPKGKKIDDVDLEEALSLLSLPRHLGNHPKTNGKIEAGLGRYGPYVMHENEDGVRDYRSLGDKYEATKVTFEEALDVLAKPKNVRGKSTKNLEPLRQLGEHPEEKNPVNIYEGPYGPYIKYGRVNVAIPKDESMETITLEKAVELIDAKAVLKKSSPRGKSKGAKKPRLRKRG